MVRKDPIVLLTLGFSPKLHLEALRGDETPRLLLTIVFWLVSFRGKTKRSLVIPSALFLTICTKCPLQGKDISAKQFVCVRLDGAGCVLLHGRAARCAGGLQ